MAKTGVRVEFLGRDPLDPFNLFAQRMVGFFEVVVGLQARRVIIPKIDDDCFDECDMADSAWRP